MIVVKDEFRAKVKEYVNNGGTAVFTYRNAVKDENNNLTLGKVIPVGYDELTGVYVDETESLQDINAFPIIGNGEFKGKNGTGGIFRDMLVPTTAEVMFKYGDDFYKNYAAVTRNNYGKGKAYYLGCSTDENTLKNIIGTIINEVGIVPIYSDEGVEFVRRGIGKEAINFVINHNGYTAQFGDFSLKPYECKIV